MNFTTGIGDVPFKAPGVCSDPVPAGTEMPVAKAGFTGGIETA
jgi:hypothetical protein